MPTRWRLPRSSQSLRSVLQLGLSTGDATKVICGNASMALSGIFLVDPMLAFGEILLSNVCNVTCVDLWWSVTFAEAIEK
jgi:hypothetical protein